HADSIVAGEYSIQIRVIRTDQIENAAVVVDHTADEQARLLLESGFQCIVEVRIDLRVGLNVFDTAQSQPLRGKVVRQSPRARIGQQAADFAVEDSCVSQHSAGGDIEQLVIRNAAPQEE